MLPLFTLFYTWKPPRDGRTIGIVDGAAARSHRSLLHRVRPGQHPPLLALGRFVASSVAREHLD